MTKVTRWQQILWRYRQWRHRPRHKTDHIHFAEKSRDWIVTSDVEHAMRYFAKFCPGQFYKDYGLKRDYKGDMPIGTPEQTEVVANWEKKRNK